MSRPARSPAPAAGTIVICSCEDTMPLDAAAVARGCGGAEVTTARQLCRSQIALARAVVSADGPLTIGCTQQARVFEELAAAAGRTAPITYVNLPETAGWSRDPPPPPPTLPPPFPPPPHPLPP